MERRLAVVVGVGSLFVSGLWILGRARPKRKEPHSSRRKRVITRPAHDIPTRRVIEGDALRWMESDVQIQGSIITSLPDHSEMRGARMTISEWRQWFSNAALACLQRTRPGEFCIFYQTDIKVFKKNTKGEGLEEWIDKAFLCQCAAAQAGYVLVWHKIAMLTEPGSIKQGRPAYAHMLCFTHKETGPINTASLRQPDVFLRGEMLWNRAMGLNACYVAIDFLVEQHKHSLAASGTIIDPFCGKGTILAVANSHGFDTVGVEIGPGRCAEARRLTLDSSEHRILES